MTRKHYGYTCKRKQGVKLFETAHFAETVTYDPTEVGGGTLGVKEHVTMLVEGSSRVTQEQYGC